MLRALIAVLAITASGAVQADVVDVIERKGGASAEQSEKPIAAGPGDTDGSSILHALVAGPFPGSNYSMSMAASAKPVVLDIVSTEFSKTLKLTDTKTKAVVGEWKIGAQTSGDERLAIAAKIGESMALNTAAVSRIDDSSRTDSQKAN